MWALINNVIHSIIIWNKNAVLVRLFVVKRKSFNPMRQVGVYTFIRAQTFSFFANNLVRRNSVDRKT